MMENCRIKFIGESKQLAGAIYEDLQKKGVSCKELDGGYEVINYAGIHCPDKAAKTCTKGSGDGVIGAEEVLEYAFDNYKKYREILEGRLGNSLPWLLDDFNPMTVFDAEVRKKIDAAIGELKNSIKAAGILDESEEYGKMLIAGIHWLVAMPPVKRELGQIETSGTFTMVAEDRMKADKLHSFWKYLGANGGLRVDGDYSEEYTALEALKNKSGECTEISMILFAILKMAEFNPVFIFEDLLREATKSPEIKEAIENTPIITSHMCVGLYVNGRMRLLDPSFINSNANYEYYTPLSLRQSLSSYYSDRGASWKEKGELDKAVTDYTKALEVDSKNATAYFNRGNAWVKKGEFDKAIADYTEAVWIHPKMTRAFNNRGVSWKQKGKLDKAIADYTKATEVDPGNPDSYFNRANAYAEKGKLDKAIADYTKVIDLDAYLKRAYFLRANLRIQKGKIREAVLDLGIAFKLDNVSFDDFNDEFVEKLKVYWEGGDRKKSADTFERETGTGMARFQANILLTYALWLNGKRNEARSEFLDTTNMDITFSDKPSKEVKQFIEKMLEAMPATMKKDKEVVEMIKMLRSDY